MPNVRKLIKDIIPPADYSHRNGFSNEHMIDKLKPNIKTKVETALLHKLSDEPEDILIVETLAYMKSVKAIPQLRSLLENCSYVLEKIKIAASLFEIIQDISLIDIAINEFRNLDNKEDSYYIYKLTSAFYYLIKFNSRDVNEIINEYTNHKEDLISYNAKRALNL